MVKIQGWVLLLAIFATQLVFATNLKPKWTNAQTCTPVDIRDDTFHIRNQRKVAWCYAYTAADLIEQHFNLKNKISASDIALTYNQHFLPKKIKSITDLIFNLTKNKRQYMPHETGFVEIALREAFKKGVCLKEDLPDNYLTKVEIQTRKEIKVPMRQAILDIKKIRDLILGKQQSIDLIGYYYKIKNLDKLSFVELITRKNYQSIFPGISDSACKNRISLSHQQLNIEQFLKGPQIFNNINKGLDLNKMVAVDYFANIFRNPKKVRIKLSSLHSSSVVARRFNNDSQQCEYLIKNSYGKSCDSKLYHSSLECDNGYIWLAEKTLWKSIVRGAYLE